MQIFKNKNVIFCLVLLVLLIALILSIVISKGNLGIDNSIYNLIINNRSTFFTEFYRFITAFGDVAFAAITSVIFILFLFLKQKKLIEAFVISVIGGGIAGTILKEIIQRPRPNSVNFLVNEGSFSFPSNHSIIAIVLYGFIFITLVKLTKKEILKYFIAAFGTLFILLLGFSRLYLGVHWFCDVIGGYLIGSIFLVLSTFIIK